MIRNCKYVIGIDAGVNTGFAVYSKEEKKLLEVSTLQLHQAMQKVKDWCFGLSVLVRVEDARQRTWIPPEKNIKQRIGRAKGAGSVSRDAKIWEEFLTDFNIPFEMVAPKNNRTKVDAAYFKKLTGWNGQTNEHGRDASMLCFGY